MTSSLFSPARSGQGAPITWRFAMRLFVTGGSGFIGSAVVPELRGAGHEVVGLARSDASAAALADRGAEEVRGDLEDLDSLRRGADGSDGVVHLAFAQDFSDMS